MTHTHSIAHHSRRRLVESRAPRLLVAAVAALLALPGIARAQSPAELPAPAFHPAPDHKENLPAEKSPGKALALSLVPTAVGAGILALAGEHDVGPLGGVAAFLVFAGPNFGHIYAGDSTTAMTQVGIRTAASGVALAGAVWALSSCSLGFFGDPSRCDSPPPGAAALMIGGAVVGTASTVYSIYDAPRAARRFNARMRPRQLTLTPAPVAGPDGTSGLGLHMTGRF